MRKSASFAAFSSRKQSDASGEGSPKSRKQKKSSPEAPSPNFASPLDVKYVVPRNEPIELWDSGLRATVRAGENLQMIAAQYGAPAWAIAQINRIGEDTPLQSGTMLIIPLRLYKIDEAAKHPTGAANPEFPAN